MKRVNERIREQLLEVLFVVVILLLTVDYFWLSMTPDKANFLTSTLETLRENLYSLFR